MLLLFHMAPKCHSKNNHTPVKPLEDSSMTYDESEDLSFWISKLEQQIKGSTKIVDLDNLHGEFNKLYGKSKNLKKKIDENMERMVNLIQNPEDFFSKIDDVAQNKDGVKF